MQVGGGLRKAGAPDCSGKSALALEFDYLDIAVRANLSAAINSFPIECGEKNKSCSAPVTPVSFNGRREIDRS